MQKLSQHWKCTGNFTVVNSTPTMLNYTIHNIPQSRVYLSTSWLFSFFSCICFSSFFFWLSVSSWICDSRQMTCKQSDTVVHDIAIKPASDYQLIRRVRLSWRCRGSWRDLRLPTGALRLADYLGRARSDWQLKIGNLQDSYGSGVKKTNPTTPLPDHCMNKKCASCDQIVNVRPIL